MPFDSCQELFGHLTTTHYSNVFSTSQEGVAVLQTNKQTDSLGGEELVLVLFLVR